MKAKQWMLAALAGFTAMCGSAAGHDGKEIWRGLGEKNRVNGAIIEPEDLIDTVVVVAAFNEDSIKKLPLDKVVKAMSTARNSKFYRLKAIASLRGHRMNAAKFAETMKDLEIPLEKSIPIYNDAGLAEGEPAAKSLPFFYVVGTNGKVLHSGTDFSKASSAAFAAVRKLPREHPIFGIAKVDKLAGDVTNHFSQGHSMKPGLNWLRKMSADKDPAVAEEARHLSAAIVQKRDMRLTELISDSNSSPGQAMWDIEELLKMWPDLKSDRKLASLNNRLKKYPDRQKMIKIVASCEREAAKPVKKPVEAKKAAAFYKSTMDRVARLQESKDAVAQGEAAKYLSRVEELHSAMQNWTPPE